MINKLNKAFLKWCDANQICPDNVAFYEDIITDEFYIWDCNIDGKKLQIIYNKLNGGIRIEY